MTIIQRRCHFGDVTERQDHSKLGFSERRRHSKHPGQSVPILRHSFKSSVRVLRQVQIFCPGTVLSVVQASARCHWQQTILMQMEQNTFLENNERPVTIPPPSSCRHPAHHSPCMQTPAVRTKEYDACQRDRYKKLFRKCRDTKRARQTPPSRFRQVEGGKTFASYVPAAGGEI